MVNGQKMRFEKYLMNEGNVSTKPTTFYHEVGCAIYCMNQSAVLNSGEDILKYFMDGTVQVKTPSLSNMPLDDIIKAYGEFLSSDEIPSTAKKIIADAKKVAGSLNDVVGKPQTTWWTGPTNDSTIFGAADIVLIIRGKEVPVSLKYGAGQLKNIGLKTLGKTLLTGVLKEGEDIVGKLKSPEFTPYWDGLTTDWINYLIKNGLTQIGKYKNSGWKSYQKIKLSSSEKESILSMFSGKNTEDNNSEFRYYARRFYQNILTKPQKKEWMNIRSKWFDLIFGGFFKNHEEIIRKNLNVFFQTQISVGEMGMWYASNGGKKVMYIPSSSEFELVSGNMKYEYSSSPSNVGYAIIMKVSNNNIDIMTITVDVRFAGGQMNNFPTTKSSMKLQIKPDDWNKMFGK